jgi:hypothetical protein
MDVERSTSSTPDVTDTIRGDQEMASRFMDFDNAEEEEVGGRANDVQSDEGDAAEGVEVEQSQDPVTGNPPGCS